MKLIYNSNSLSKFNLRNIEICCGQAAKAVIDGHITLDSKAQPSKDHGVAVMIDMGVAKLFMRYCVFCGAKTESIKKEDKYYKIYYQRLGLEPLAVGVTTCREDVLAEEPDAILKEITKEEYHEFLRSE